MKLAIAALLVAGALGAQELRTAAGHPIEYYVSLPDGWSAGRKWPLVVIIESANREFRATLNVFVKARRGLPFILLAPLVTTNGGANYRQARTYHYTDAVWQQIERDRCGFDRDGIAAAARDARRLYGAEDRYYLTGWEAGGHTVWSTIFEHPEALRAAAPAVTNYAGRCLDEGFSTSPARADLPIVVFQVASGRDVAPGKYVYEQSEQARRLAAGHGFQNISERIVPDKPHGPLAEEVLAWFASLR